MTVEILGWTLLHFLWQGAVAALALAALCLLLRRGSPQLRYLAASATLMAMLCMPVATFTLLRASQWTSAEAAPNPSPTIAAATAAAGESAASAGRTVLTLRSRIEPALPAFVGLWAAGVVLLSLRSLGGWTLTLRLRRSGLAAVPAQIETAMARVAVALRVSRPVRLFQSAMVEVPTCVGWLRPLILLPASTLAGLSVQQLELLLAHELAHVRRRDYLVNLVQTAAETLLFYHPAVWWVSQRMRVEREHCCDDMAVAACGDALSYARVLATLEERRSAAPVLAMAADGASLLARVRRLVSPSPESRSPRPALAATALLTAAAGAGTLLLAGSMVSPTWTALAQEEPEPAVDRGAAMQASRNDANEPETDVDANTRGFSLDLILEMARQGVTPEYIDEMAELGYPSLTPEELIALSSQDVDADYVRELAQAGYRELSPDQLIELRSQDVSGEFARELKEQGLDDLSLGELLELRSQDISPEYVAELRRAGQEKLSVSRLISLRSQDVDGEFVTELKALGYEGLSANRLIALRSMDVTPEYIRDIAQAGYPRLELPTLIELRNQDVTPEFVAGLREAGYSDLPVGALIELRSADVSPAYVRELRQAGVEGLSVEELIELRSEDVSPELIRRVKGRR